MVNSASFVAIATQMMKVSPEPRDFIAWFGATPKIINDVWHAGDFDDVEPKHLLWACLLLRVYATESICARMVGVTRKTFRKYAWKCIHKVADLFPAIVSLATSHWVISTAWQLSDLLLHSLSDTAR
jgi:hypothetical protein